MADKPAHRTDTQLTHLGRITKADIEVVNTPVYRASTVLFPDFDAIDANRGEYTYGRRGTPTSRSFEEAINALEGGALSVLVPSGLAAVTLAILTACRAGDHLLMTDSAYGPTRGFCERTLKRFGVETSYYDPLIGGGIMNLFRRNTAAVFCESPGSQSFEVQDIPAIAAAARARGIAVIADNTWATPLLFKPLAHGCDLSVQAVTKYIGGHSDLLMGYVCANATYADRLNHTHGDLGQFAGGDDVFLALRGLRTLGARLPHHAASAMTIARWLQARPEVERVLFPALDDDPGHALWKRDFAGASGLFGVVLKPVAREGLAAFMNGLTLFGMGWSWGGYESLITPGHMTRTVTPLAGEGPVVRLSIGLEAPEDLIADLELGFTQMAAVR